MQINLHFDPKTALTTLLGFMLVAAIRRASWLFRRSYVYVLDAFFWTANRIAKQNLASWLSLRRYCLLELGQPASRYLHVPGTFGVALETDRVYVPLLLAEGPSTDRAYTHETIFDAGSRIRVIGDPGSGKSSLIKRLHRDAAAQAVTSRRRARLPIRIELKSFVPPTNVAERDLTRWGLNYIRELVSSTVAFDMDESYETYVSGNGLLLLLDGLDEVSTDAYERVSRLIRGVSDRLARMSDKNVVVLTMRTQFHSQVGRDFDSAFPRTLQIRPFSSNDIFLFLSRWPFGERRVDAEANRIYSDLTDRPTLREMCTNPLVLAMYVATDQRTSDPAELPETRTAFYESVLTELLVVRRSRQLGPGPARTALKRQRESILGRLALEHMLNPAEPANSLSWEAATRLVEEILGLSAEDSETYLRELSKETGLFAEEREGETLRFIHLTFCEFLAALEAAEGRASGWADLVRAQSEFACDAQPQVRTRLAEVIPFTVGLTPRNRLAEVVTEASNSGDSRITARCFLETQAYDHPAWLAFSREEANEISSTPPHNWDAEWLARLQLLAVLLREAERWAASEGRDRPPVTSDELFQRLVGTDDERLVKVFAAYASQDAAASFRLAEACGVDLVTERPDLLVDACVEPPFLSLALERAGNDAARAVPWAQILAEAGLRFRVVARELGTIPQPPSWSRPLTAVPAREHWPDPYRRQSRTYWNCLTLACAAEKVSPNKETAFPLVRLLAKVSPPMFMSQRSRSVSQALSLGLVGLPTAAVIFFVHNLGILPGTVLGFVLSFAMISLVFGATVRVDLYLLLLNISGRPPELRPRPAGGIRRELWRLEAVRRTIVREPSRFAFPFAIGNPWMLHEAVKYVDRTVALEATRAAVGSGAYGRVSFSRDPHDAVVVSRSDGEFLGSWEPLE